MKKPTYIRCPRCELNYIKSTEKYCPVCKAEMRLEGGLDLSFEDDELELCPVCGQNFIRSDQTMCDECAKKKSTDELDEEENSTIWSADIEEAKPEEADDDVELVSMSEIAEDEEAFDDDVEDEEEESDKIEDSIEDDLDLDFDEVLDGEDDEDDEDEEDYEDEEDEDDEEEDDHPKSKKSK